MSAGGGWLTTTITEWKEISDNRDNLIRQEEIYRRRGLGNLLISVSVFVCLRHNLAWLMEKIFITPGVLSDHCWSLPDTDKWSPAPDLTWPDWLSLCSLLMSWCWQYLQLFIFLPTAPAGGGGGDVRLRAKHRNIINGLISNCRHLMKWSYHTHTRNTKEHRYQRERNWFS